jgi:sugar O-acyltransferase (sialic acid O-acetyltransferase NeuD family)
VALLGYPVNIHDSLDNFVPEEGCFYVLGTVTPQIYVLVEELKAKYRLPLSALVHPKAYLGSNVHIGEGVTIFPGASIGSNTFLDDFSSVQRLAAIGHDAYIGKYTNIGPVVALAGTTRIGNKCRIGMGAIVLNYVEVGDWAVIGAGAIVTRDIPEKVVAYGVPAKVVRANDETDFEVYKAKRLLRGVH